MSDRARLEVVATLHQLIETLSEQPEPRSTTYAPQQRDLPLLLDAAEAGKLLSLSRAKVFDLAHKGEIPSIRIGRSMRIPRDQLVSWIVKNANEASYTTRVRLPSWARVDRSDEL